MFDHIAFEIYHTKQMKDLIEWMKDSNDILKEFNFAANFDPFLNGEFLVRGEKM